MGLERSDDAGILLIRSLEDLGTPAGETLALGDGEAASFAVPNPHALLSKPAIQPHNKRGAEQSWRSSSQGGQVAQGTIYSVSRSQLYPILPPWLF